jgi:hypothetical protein
MARAFVALSILLACGCTGLGKSRLYDDQLGYAKALNEGEKSGTLLNVVRIRYGDSPTFLQATQVIAGYQFLQSAGGGFEAFPAANPSTFLTGTVGGSLTESPTFTFQPLSGEQFAQSFVRPLSASDLLPLAMSGMPIDVLFRLGVQSVNAYSNAVPLADVGAAGSAEFFQLLYDLRRLQIVGLLNVRLSQTRLPVNAAGPLPNTPPAPPTPAAPAPDAGVPTPAASTPAPASSVPAPTSPPPAPVPTLTNQTSGIRGVSNAPPYVYLTFSKTSDPALTKISDEAKLLMSMPVTATDAEVVYGRTPEPGQVAMVTRSVLGVMSQIAIQISVPADDITRHRTLPTVGNVGLERRPVVVVHCGHTKPPATFTSARYGDNTFWIDEDDFDSKLAFTVLQVLLALSRSSGGPGPLVSVPAH